jgi:hypothetical protein
MTVRVGAQIHPQQASYARTRDAWLRVEELGADTLFTWDHFFPLYGAPDYDLSPLRELIAWRDDYRERIGEDVAS